MLQELEELGTEYGNLRDNASLQLAVALWLSDQKDAAISHLNDEVAHGIEKGSESSVVVFAARKLLFELEIKRGRHESALPYARAALNAALPKDEQPRKHAAKAAEQILENLEVTFADKPDVLVEIFRSALNNGHTGGQVWRRLGVALYGRYQSGKEMRDLRHASVCLLRAGEAGDMMGVKIIREWIREDKLATGLSAPEFLIDSKSSWSYQEATPEDTAWRLASFDAGEWPNGRCKFGYGDGDEVTLLGFGSDPNDKPESACFRIELTVRETYERALVASIAFDDGAIVYIEGEEVYRALLPKGEPRYDALAVGTKSNESQSYGFAINPELLSLDHPVVIAVQVHQSPHESDDLSFEFSLAEPLPVIDDALDCVPTDELNAFFGKLTDLITRDEAK